MKIIDAHVHIVEKISGFCRRGELRGIGNGKARWANGEVMELIPKEYGDKDFTGEALIKLMNDNNVEKAVLMQGSLYGFQNEYTFEICERYPDKFIGACTVDLFAKNYEEILDRFIKELNFKILKLELSSGGGQMGYHESFEIDGERMKNIWEKAARNNLVVVLDVGDSNMESYQPKAIRNMALKYPSLKIVVCHLTAPTVHSEEQFRKTIELLKLPNIWFDLAALPSINAPEKYPFPNTSKFVNMAKNIVGADKLIWGTDAPMTAVSEPYSSLINYLIEADIFTKEELEQVFYNNAREVYFQLKG